MNAQQAKYRLDVAGALLGTGMLRPVRPDRTARALMQLYRWGVSAAGAYALSLIHI